MEQVQAALRPNTRLIYAETPANPILRIADIAALARLHAWRGAAAGGRFHLGQPGSCNNR